MKLFSKLLTKMSGALAEVNSPNWSLTKVAMLAFMYPTITGVYIYDVLHHTRMDVINSMVFICAITAPRFASQLLAARFGIKNEPVKTPDPEPSVEVAVNVDIQK